MVNIPQSIFNTYNSYVDDFIIDNFGVNCKLVYPALKTECPNCIVDLIGQKSSNLYKSGGPYPFQDGMICPYCNGDGFRSDSPTETIKLRVYWNKKEWQKIGMNVNMQDGAAQIIGFLTDMPKIRKAVSIEVLSDYENAINYKFILSGETFPWGFKKNRYFVGFLDRV